MECIFVIIPKALKVTEISKAYWRWVQFQASIISPASVLTSAPLTRLIYSDLAQRKKNKKKKDLPKPLPFFSHVKVKLSCLIFVLSL